MPSSAKNNARSTRSAKISPTTSARSTRKSARKIDVTPEERAVISLTHNLITSQGVYVNAVEDYIQAVEDKDKRGPTPDQRKKVTDTVIDLDTSIKKVNEALIDKAEEVNDLHKKCDDDLERYETSAKNIINDLRAEIAECKKTSKSKMEDLESNVEDKYYNKLQDDKQNIAKLKKEIKKLQDEYMLLFKTSNDDREKFISELKIYDANYKKLKVELDNKSSMVKNLQNAVALNCKNYKKKCAGKNALSSKSRYSSQNKDIVNNDDSSPELIVISKNPYLNLGGSHSSNHRGGRNSKSKKHSPNKRNTKKTRKHHKKHTRKHK